MSFASFAELMEKSDFCIRKAVEYLQKGDINMADFYKNASEGFKAKALNMKIK